MTYLRGKWKWLIALLIPVAFMFTTIRQDKHVGAEPSAIMGEESQFAHVTNGVVDNVIVASQENINAGLWGDPSDWKRTSPSGTTRKNHAGNGYTYDATIDAFVPPKPTGAKDFDESKARWIDTPPEKSSFINSTST